MFNQNDLVLETGRLQKFALRLTKNQAHADDLVQSTCLRALEKMDYFEDGSNLFSWTSKIMYNLFVSGYRRRVKHESQYGIEAFMNTKLTSIKPEQDTHMEMADVGRAMSMLSLSHRDVIMKVCIEGRHYQEVSKMLSIPVGTVRSRLSRARARLHTILTETRATPATISDLGYKTGGNAGY